MERAGRADHFLAVGVTIHEVVFARDFQRAFHCLGAGIAEKAGIREGIRHQAVGETLLLRDVVEVRDMPEFAGLLLNLGDQMRVRVAEGVRRDTAGEVEISSPIGAVQVGSFAALESDVDPPVSGHHRCNHETSPSRKNIERPRGYANAQEGPDKTVRRRGCQA